MADPLITKEEFELTRNISSEYLSILDTKRKMVGVAQAELNIQKSSLESLKDKDDELYRSSKALLTIKGLILKDMKNHVSVSSVLKDAYVRQSNIVKNIQKDREKSLENEEKSKKLLEDLDNKFGGMFQKMKKMKESFNISPNLFLANIEQYH